MTKARAQLTVFKPTDPLAGAKIIFELAQAAYATGAPWPLAVIAENLVAPTSQYWLAQVANQPVGFLSGGLVIDEAELTNVGVVRDWQGHGIGRQLILQWLATLPENTVVTLEVRTHNRAAIGLYQSLGFAKIATRKRYYNRPVEDAQIMQLIRKDHHVGDK